jgi:hypothetical protein
MRALAALTLAAAVALLAVACGGGDAGPAATGPLTVEQALASDDGEMTVRGFVVAPDGEPVRLCSALLESYPPQCGGGSLVVVGLDLDGVPGITRADEPDLDHTAWTNDQVEIEGELADGVLHAG